MFTWLDMIWKCVFIDLSVFSPPNHNLMLLTLNEIIFLCLYVYVFICTLMPLQWGDARASMGQCIQVSLCSILDGFGFVVYAAWSIIFFRFGFVKIIFFILSNPQILTSLNSPCRLTKTFHYLTIMSNSHLKVVLSPT